MAVLAIFAQARQQAIQDAVGARRNWPTEWLSDVNAAYAVLARHPFGTDEQVAAHYDFLLWLGAPGPSRRVLDTGLERFPGSAVLHDRLRRRVLWARGVDGLQQTYDELLAASDASPLLHGFAGLAAMDAAEFRRRAGKEAAADADYVRALAHFEQGAARRPEARADADHQIALALSGRARLAYERGDDDAALEHLLASLDRRPESAGDLDGLNLSAMDTARVLRVRLLEEQRGDALQRLDDVLRALDPSLLELPAYEQELPPVTPPEGQDQDQDAGAGP
jgi:tetratricopeptide (TPR) repeat protein